MPPDSSVAISEGEEAIGTSGVRVVVRRRVISSRLGLDFPVHKTGRVVIVHHNRIDGGMVRSLDGVDEVATTKTMVPVHEGVVRTCTPDRVPPVSAERRAFVTVSIDLEVGKKRTKGSA